MDYARHLFEAAWGQTWNAVFNAPLVTVILAIAVFGLSTLIHWWRKGFSSVKDTLVIAAEGVVATVAIFGLVFLFHILFLTPKKMVEESQHIAAMATNDARTLRNKLSDLSPSSQSDEIKRLQSVVRGFEERDAEQAKHEWPPLTDEQITEWVKALIPYPILVIKVAWGRRVKADKLFESLQTVGKRLPRCNVQYFEGAYTDESEIGIVTTKSNPVGDVILRLFKEARWPVKLEHLQYKDAETGPEKDSVDIYIPEKT